MESKQERQFEHEIKEMFARKGIEITPDVQDRIARKIAEIKNYIPKIGIFGKTGVGKSSLSNALFGADISEVSDVAACTREPKEFMLGLAASDSRGLILIDCPGLGETEERDEEYKALYRNLIPELDLVLWVLDSSERAYGADKTAYRELFAQRAHEEKVIFVLNKIDDFKPKGEWNEEMNTPGQQQSILIMQKEEIVRGLFGVSEDRLCSISVEKKYSLGILVEFIISAVPNEKKYSFVREAADENVSAKAKEAAETGFFKAIWTSIKGGAVSLKDVYVENKKEIHAIVSAIYSAWTLLKKSK